MKLGKPLIVLLALVVATGVGLKVAYPEPAAGDATPDHYVDAGGSNTSPYETPAKAAYSIQDAITVAAAGDKVHVAAGTYNELITLKNGVEVLGAGQEATTIDGTSLTGPVVTATGVTSATKLDGFTITNGSANYGAGMYNSSTSSPVVTNCTFSGNTAQYGGGMYNSSFSFATSSSPTVSNCTFSGNTATSQGGGMYNSEYSEPTVSNCTFSGNTANAEGGGMLNTGWLDGVTSPTVTNCTFANNSSGQGGAGMFNII